MGARWVDPALSRWLSADTLVPSPENPQALNRYSYILGNPLRYVDPTGHFSPQQLAEWYGENWESLFDDAWITLLLEAEFGDMVLYGYDDKGLPLLAMFGLDRDTFKLDVWNVFPGGQQSGRVIPFSKVIEMSDPTIMALYRSEVANLQGGPSDDPENTWLYDARFRHYVRVSGSYDAPACIDLAEDWYRGSHEHVWAVGYPADMDAGYSDVFDLLKTGIGAASLWLAGKTIGSAILKSLGGGVGVFGLAVSVYDWMEWDTGFWIDNNGPGLPPPARPPEP